MNRRTALSILAAGAARHVAGADDAWAAETSAGLAAMDKGHRSEAEQHFALALSQAREAKAGGLMLAQCLDNLARATDPNRGGRRELYRESLAIREGLLKPDDPELARSLVRFALASGLRQGDPDEAEKMFTRATKIAGTAGTPELSAEVKEAHGLFRHSNYRIGDDSSDLLQRVEPLYREVLAIREKLPGDGEIALAQILEMMSVLFRETQRDEEANRLFARATPIRRRHFEALSPAPYTLREPFRIGGGVSAPGILSKREPEYSDLARMLKWQGTVVLTLVVSESGATDSIRLTRGLGLGLDEQSLLAVREWVFKPGMRQGAPVRVIASVEVNFRLL